MVRIQIVEVGPWVDYMPFLKLVVLSKQFIQLIIPSSFISIAPNDDGRMIDITLYHFFHQFASYFFVVAILPSCQFIHVYDT